MTELESIDDSQPREFSINDNGNDLVGQPDEIKSKKKCRICVVIILLILIAATVTVIIILKKNSEQSINLIDSPYFCQIDAGSTSSKLYAYKLEKLTDDSFPQVIELLENKIKPPIANLETEEEMVIHVNKLLDMCEEVVTQISEMEVDLKTVPFFF